MRDVVRHMTHRREQRLQTVEHVIDARREFIEFITRTTNLKTPVELPCNDIAGCGGHGSDPFQQPIAHQQPATGRQYEGQTDANQQRMIKNLPQLLQLFDIAPDQQMKTIAEQKNARARRHVAPIGAMMDEFHPAIDVGLDDWPIEQIAGQRLVVGGREQIQHGTRLIVAKATRDDLREALQPMFDILLGEASDFRFQGRVGLTQQQANR